MVAEARGEQGLAQGRGVCGSETRAHASHSEFALQCCTCNLAALVPAWLCSSATQSKENVGCS